ncbi:hypothetical protein [Herbidospora mongoliensis]|nr:hypothetical protein [Herbidospora mongoliensis]
MPAAIGSNDGTTGVPRVLASARAGSTDGVAVMALICKPGACRSD